MYSAWKRSTVVTVSSSGFTASHIFSKLSKVGHDTPSACLASSARFGLMSHNPTNSTWSA